MVAQLGSFAEVARVLGYTEPAVHLQIATLKKVLGGELFYRADRRMQLTPLGERLLPYASEAVAAVDKISAEVSSWRATEGHVLRVGLGRSSGTYLFPFVAATLTERMPEVMLQPSIMPLDEIMEAFSKGTIDLAIITGLRTRIQRSPTPRQIAAAPLAAYYWTLVARADLAAGFNPACDRSISIFVPNYAASMAEEIEQRAGAVLRRPAIELSPNDEAAKANALAGRGLAYLPEHVCRLEFGNGELVHCLPAGGRQRSTVDIGHALPVAHRDIAPAIAALRSLRRRLLPAAAHSSDA